MTTVDHDEIARFNEFSNALIWWSKDNHLFKMNQIRVPFVLQELKKERNLLSNNISSSKPLKGLKILDVGCGAGLLTEPLAKLGATMTGLDASEGMLNVAKMHAQEDPEIKNSTEYVCATIEDFSQTHKNTFDAVVACEIIEHVNNPELFLKCCVKTLKPGGSLFITTINKTWNSWFTAIILYERVFGYMPRGTHEWNKFISPEDVKQTLKAYNCRTNNVTGGFYNIATGNWSFSPNPAVYYYLHAVKNN